MLIGSTTSHFAQFEDIFNNERVTLGNVGGGSELKVDGEEGQNKQAIRNVQLAMLGLMMGHNPFLLLTLQFSQVRNIY